MLFVGMLFALFRHLEDEQQQEHRRGEEGEEMGADTKAEEERDEAEPAGCLAGVGAAIPSQHRP